jgi:thiamine-phosphate pyrophosphorylase
MSQDAKPPQVCLLTGVGPAARDRLAAVVAAIDVASVFIEPTDPTSTAPLVEVAQKAGAAALIVGDARLARTLRADGVHLPLGPTIEDDFAAAKDILGERYIVGAEAGTSRHLAMVLAEAGAEYVAFRVSGDGTAAEDGLDMVDWWAEVFTTPCVAYDAIDLDMAAALAGRGADFVCIRLTEGQSPADAADKARAFAQALRAVAEVS